MNGRFAPPRRADTDCPEPLLTGRKPPPRRQPRPVSRHLSEETRQTGRDWANRIRRELFGKDPI